MSSRGAPAVTIAALAVLVLAIAASSSGSAPNATFSVSVTATPSYGTPPLTVALQATVTSGTPTSYNWTFGDGSFYNGTNASAAAPSHTFAAPGLYNVSVAVYEGTAVATASIPVHVVAQLLQATVSASALSGVAPITITFTATVTGGTGTYVNYTWQFGNGGTGAGATVRYTYSEPGTFHAVVTVYDSANASTAAGLWLNVSSSGTSPTASWLGLLPWILSAFLLGVLAVVLVIWTRQRPGRRSPVPSPPSAQSADEAPAPAATASVATTAAPTDETLRISQRIVVHLAQLGRLGPDEVATDGFTQGGMSTALGVPQTSLTNVLRRLEAAGILTVDTRHVRGRARRLKIYRLTARGEELARDLRHPGSNPDRTPQQP